MSWSSPTGWSGRGWSRAVAGGGGSASFVASSSIYLGSTSTLPEPTGSAALDIIIAECFSDGSATTFTYPDGSGTTLLALTDWGDGFDHSAAASRVISSTGNITVNSPYNSGMAIAHTIRGATAITERSTASYVGGSGGSVTVTGYTPGVGSLGAVLLLMSRDTALGAGGGGFTAQADSGATWPFGISAIYTNFTYAGGNFSFTPNSNAGAGAFLILCELS